jgi:large subunit ribosomal protein L25
MDTVKLVVQKRMETGKGQARRLRQAGKLPAVVYGRGDTEALTVEAKELLLIRQGGENTIIDLEIGGDAPEMCSVILREVQIDPVSRAQIHADFYRLAMDELITVTVPLEFINIPEDRLKVVQMEASVLARELMVECLPREIPNVIEVDLEDLQVGDVLHAGAIALPRGVTLVTNEDEAVVTTSVITGVEEAVEPEEGQALAAMPEGAPREAEAADAAAEDDD